MGNPGVLDPEYSVALLLGLSMLPNHAIEGINVA
jgi:hypothetical protein